MKSDSRSCCRQPIECNVNVGVYNEQAQYHRLVPGPLLPKSAILTCQSPSSESSPPTNSSSMVPTASTKPTSPSPPSTSSRTTTTPSTMKLETDIPLVASVNKTYPVGEHDWTANNPQAASQQFFYDITASHQSGPEPVVVEDFLWWLFMHDVQNYNVYINHSDGFRLQYGTRRTRRRIICRLT